MSLKDKKPNKNPFCDGCKIPMRKKGTVKIGELRFICPKCYQEK